jgi:hypothetical protein
MTHRIMFVVVVFAALVITSVLAPMSASAQLDAGIADAGTPDSGTAPFCTSGHVLGCVCPDGQHEDASGVCVPNVPNAPRAAQLGYCIMPDGSGVADDGAHRCGCPAGTLPFAVERHRSVDRLRSLGVPRGYAVFACANPMATHGSSDSVETRIVSLPTDLSPLIRQIENLASALADEHVLVDRLVTTSRTHTGQIADNVTRTEVLSGRLDALSQCIQYGEGRAVTYVENGVTRTYTCSEFLAANRQEETRHVSGEGPRAFVLAQAFDDLAFTPLRYGDTDYGLPWSVGVELTLGVPIGGVWHIQFGGALGGAFPKVPGVTNVFVMPSIGFGVTKPISRNVHFAFGFGGLAGLRFQPDGHLAHNVYAPYMEGLFRFNARSAWSPVLGLRLYAGVAPHAANGTFEVPFTAGGIVTFGFGHF